MTGRTFKIVLIKPSHYDDNGYVIQWRPVHCSLQQPRVPLRRDGD